MDQNASELLLFPCSHGADAPERATIPFIAATTAAVSGQRAAVVCTVEAVRLGLPGGAEAAEDPDLPPLADLVHQFTAAGGEIWLCSACTTKRGITGDDVIDGARIVGAAAAERGLIYLDAPVSGGVGGAKAGTLTFIVGGSEEGYAQAKPVLEGMGKNIFHAGEIGAGQVAKICNNMILGISMIAVSEAFALGRRLGGGAWSHRCPFGRSRRCPRPRNCRRDSIYDAGPFG